MSDEIKRAPVQGLVGGIPWEMHLRAYEAYCKKYSPQKALIEGGCRGGFGVEELDEFIPGWRDELSKYNHVIQALRVCISAHKTGRFEPMQIAIENAQNVLEDLTH